MSSPSSRIVPAVGSIRRSTSLPTVDLPQPDSPTRHSVSPGLDREARRRRPPSPARRAPRAGRAAAGKCFLRLSTSRTTADGHAGHRCAGRSRRSASSAGDARGRSPMPFAQRRRLARGSARSRRRQRGAKAQPAIGSRSEGTMPGISARRLARAPGAAARDRGHQPARVGMRRPVEQLERSAASSTLRPAYMTTTRWQVSATTPRSWVMRITAAPVRSFSSQHQLEDLRLDRDVERRRRLVGDQQRAGCRRAPWRSSRAGACRRRTGADSRRGGARASGMRTSSQHLDGARSRACGRRWRPCGCAPTSAIWWPTVSTGLSVVIGSWKIMAMRLPRMLAHLRLVERRRGRGPRSVTLPRDGARRVAAAAGA